MTGEAGVTATKGHIDVETVSVDFAPIRMPEGVLHFLFNSGNNTLIIVLAGGI